MSSLADLQLCGFLTSEICSHEEKTPCGMLTLVTLVARVFSISFNDVHFGSDPFLSKASHKSQNPTKFEAPQAAQAAEIPNFFDPNFNFDEWSGSPVTSSDAGTPLSRIWETTFL